MGQYEIQEWELPNEYHTLLHTLWTKAVGTDKYSKTEWQQLERLLRRLSFLETRDLQRRI